MNETPVLETQRPPSVYFIDDSATMREVMKIAFRRENISVVACQDATKALAEIEQAQPDVVITDVIMPDKDGFEVCQFIKQHPRLNQTPVLLLSGVVDREVAEKAAGVKADDLIRKPFQPRELIARVKRILAPKGSTPAVLPANGVPKSAVQAATPANAASSGVGNQGAALSGIFSNAPGPARLSAPSILPPPVAGPSSPSALPSAAVPPASGNTSAATATPPRGVTANATKLRLEVLRLETLVKKLQAELAAEREYARALEEHVKTLQEAE